MSCLVAIVLNGSVFETTTNHCHKNQLVNAPQLVSIPLITPQLDIII